MEAEHENAEAWVEKEHELGLQREVQNTRQRSVTPERSQSGTRVSIERTAEEHISWLRKPGAPDDGKARNNDSPAEEPALGRALSTLKNENKRLIELLHTSDQRCNGPCPALSTFPAMSGRGESTQFLNDSMSLASNLNSSRGKGART